MIAERSKELLSGLELLRTVSQDVRLRDDLVSRRDAMTRARARMDARRRPFGS